MSKKIETREDSERKKRRTKLVIGIIIIVLMILSTIGFAMIENNQEVVDNTVYNGYKFTSTSSGWQTTVQGQTITTSYFPTEVLNVTGSNVYAFDFTGKVVYIAVGSQEEVYDVNELGNLNNIAERSQFACQPEAENSSFCQESGLPIKSCEDVNSSNTARVIVINSNVTEPASYTYYNNCLTINAQSADLKIAVDNFIFKIFGIIK
ncbi:MAG: hypothetical protein NTX24_01535 [Candidatus Pacearchaeota archaeon]|nr:hypothetical protein [Candidatus Pacearchaeota archaeon]